MPYNPMMYQPYQYQTNYQRPFDGILGVNGIEGARAYQMPPSSRVALFDQNSDVVFVKSTDAGGFPTIQTFTLTPVEQQQNQPAYITREELAAQLDALRKELGNGEQLVSAE